MTNNALTRAFNEFKANTDYEVYGLDEEGFYVKDTYLMIDAYLYIGEDGLLEYEFHFPDDYGVMTLGDFNNFVYFESYIETTLESNEYFKEE